MGAQGQVPHVDGPQSGQRYDLTDAEIRKTVAAYLGQTRLPAGRFVGVVVGTEGAIANVGRTIERAVFEETFEGNDASFMESAYRVVEKSTRFLIVLDREEGRPAGVLRIVDDEPYVTLESAPQYIGNSKESIKNYHGIQRGELCWDVATLAIPVEYRGGAAKTFAVGPMLYRMLFLQGTLDGVRHIFFMIDGKARRVLDNLGLHVEFIHGHDESFEYWGSRNTYAMYARFEQWEVRSNSFSHGYRTSLRRFLDIMHYLVGDHTTKKGKAAMKRLGLARAARMILTGKNLDKSIVLDESPRVISW